MNWRRGFLAGVGIFAMAVIAGLAAAWFVLWQTGGSSALIPADDAAAAAADHSSPDWPAKAPTPEQVLYAQQGLMQKALAKVTPGIAGKVELYVLAFAGDGTEDVFRNEAEYAAQLFAQRFHATGHTLVLENNPATLATTPLATWSNLENALAGLHQRMNAGEDILLVYMTSHGSADHYLSVDMPPLPLDAIGADDLADILDEHAFPWRVIVVNSCYSGGFIPPLAADGTMVITAASADSTSFGCGAESHITWFGDAFLARALNHTGDFSAAFDAARTTVAGWEKRDGETPSEPQINIGAGIRAQLERWRAAFPPGPAVPFRVAGAQP